MLIITAIVMARLFNFGTLERSFVSLSSDEL